jgi:alkanesulfonate monooxygenase SsuD/methylene tetrahydromethanopterin reductase-like flavin-dependent oxidoreductase (luciferase family)
MPLWVGGNGPRAIERAARHGNGWHPLFPTPEAYRAAREQILAVRAAASLHDPFAFAMSCPGTRIVLDDDPPQQAAPSRYDDVPAEYGYAPAFPTDDRGRLRFVGNPDELAGDVRAYAAAGVEHLALRFWTTDPAATVDDVIDQMARWQRDVATRV